MNAASYDSASQGLEWQSSSTFTFFKAMVKFFFTTKNTKGHEVELGWRLNPGRAGCEDFRTSVFSVISCETGNAR
jgi:hypothetical protein